MNEKFYTPHADERQLTFRSMMMGFILGAGVSVINAYLGLKTGWSMSGSLIAAIFGYLFFNCFNLKSPYTVLENNITETAGSAVSVVVPSIGLLTVMPALKMLGYPMSVTEMYLWGLATCLLGTFMAVPLRSQFIILNHFRFPTGTATAETIVALHARDAAAKLKAKIILWSALLAGIYVLASYFWPVLAEPPIFQLIGLAVIVPWGFGIPMSPMLFGAGIMIGPRIGLSLLVGAIISWGILGPWLTQEHLVTGKLMDYQHGVAGWILWPGVALLVSESIVNFIITFVKMLRSRNNSMHVSLSSSWPISFKIWLAGLLILIAFACVILQWVFKIPYYLTLIAIAFSSVLSIVASRSLGETDINPLTAVGKVTQLGFGELAPGHVTTNLLAGGVAQAAACNAAEMLQDWKSGYLLGASAKAQFIVQVIGVLVGLVVSIPIYLLFDHAYQIGSGDFPAPSAHGWQAMAQLLSGGLSVLPQHTGIAILIGSMTGCLFALLRLIKPIAPFVPSGVAMGIAFIVPAMYSVTMFLGALLAWIWLKISPRTADDLSFQLASGMIIGEGLMGAVVAILTLLDH